MIISAVLICLRSYVIKYKEPQDYYDGMIYLTLDALESFRFQDKISRRNEKGSYLNSIAISELRETILGSHA